MLSERLRAVMDRAASLPQDEQDKLAEQLEEALDEPLWSVRVGKGYRALGYRRGSDIRWM
jgi:hypothetical protein